MKVIISESQYNRLIDSFITFIFEPHEVKTTKKYPTSVFWVKDGQIIAEIENSYYFWLHYKIWDKISNQFGLDLDETQLVIKTWLEQHYGLGELTLDEFLYGHFAVLEQHYGLGELTPRLQVPVLRGWNNIMDWGD